MGKVEGLVVVVERVIDPQGPADVARAYDLLLRAAATAGSLGERQAAGRRGAREVRLMTRAGGAISSTPLTQGGDGGANPTPALHLSPRDLVVRMVPAAVAAELFVRHHYLHAAPAGVKLSFGVFAGDRLAGAVGFNAGPINGWRLVDGARREDCLCLARLWLADDLPPNSESRVVGLVVRLLRRHTAVRFLVSYADPAAGHVGTIYQAAGWPYTGTAEAAQPLMALGDGPPRHTRTIASTFGTHSAAFFRSHGIDVHLVATLPKHRYVTFVDPAWRSRLRAPVLPYRRKGDGPVEIQEVPIDLLRPAEWNANEADAATLGRLGNSLQRFGVVVPLVVRALGEAYEVLSGNQRLRVFREQGVETVPCVEVQADDARARLLAQALNALHGTDDLNKKAALVRDILAAMPADEVAAILPDTVESMKGLASIGQASPDALGAQLADWSCAQEARAATKLHVASFPFTDQQKQVVIRGRRPRPAPGDQLRRPQSPGTCPRRDLRRLDPRSRLPGGWAPGPAPSPAPPAPCVGSGDTTTRGGTEQWLTKR